MEAVKARKCKKKNDNGDQELTRKEIEATLKQYILRLGYKALKTEQENAIVPLASPSEYQKYTLLLHLSTSETLCCQAEETAIHHQLNVHCVASRKSHCHYMIHTHVNVTTAHIQTQTLPLYAKGYGKTMSPLSTPPSTRQKKTVQTSSHHIMQCLLHLHCSGFI